MALGLPKVGSRSVQPDFAEPHPELGQVVGDFADPEPDPQMNRGSVRLGCGSKVNPGQPRTSVYQVISHAKNSFNGKIKLTKA